MPNYRPIYPRCDNCGGKTVLFPRSMTKKSCVFNRLSGEKITYWKTQKTYVYSATGLETNLGLCEGCEKALAVDNTTGEAHYSVMRLPTPGGAE